MLTNDPVAVVRSPSPAASPARPRTVRLTIVYNFLDGACYSVWGALLLPVLLRSVSDSDVAVGNAAAAAGLAQLFAAGIAGWLGDRFRRQALIRVGALWGFLSLAMFLHAVRASVTSSASTPDSVDSSSSSSSGSSSTIRASAWGSSGEEYVKHSSYWAAGQAETARDDLRASLRAVLAYWSRRTGSPDTGTLTDQFIVAQLAWGLYVGFVSTSSEALFADCVRSGERTAIYSLKWIVQTLCYVVGYVAALLLLLVLGNEWEMDNVRRVMVCGLAAHPIALLTLFFLRDRDAIAERETNAEAAVVAAVDQDEEEGIDMRVETGGLSPTMFDPTDAASSFAGGVEDAVLEGDGSDWASERPFGAVSGSTAGKDSNARYGEERTSSLDGTSSPLLLSPLVSGLDASGRARGEAAAPSPRDNTMDLQDRIAVISQQSWQRHALRQVNRRHALSRSLHACSFVLCSWAAVPYLVCLVDLLMALGSGMTLLYFPLFFKDEVGVRPTQMYVAYLTSTCLTALTSHLARIVAERWLNRIPAVLLVRTVGTISLLLMGVSPVYVVSDGVDGNARTRRPHAALLFLALFIVRNACMNAVMGMTRSVIMDAVKKENRAKWSAFESFSSFTWAGSAVIGGYIAGAKGYQFSFTVTACLHLSAGLLLLPAAVGAHRVEQMLREARATHPHD